MKLLFDRGQQQQQRMMMMMATKRGAFRSNSSLVAGGLGVAAAATAAQYALKAYNSSDLSKTSLFSRRFYEGPFESKMTRREAALILGVRESATAERIKDAHRRILRINHPDLGGSAFIAGKINEAKELLIKNKN